MIPIRDNTTTIWVMGAIILANMFMLHDSMWGFFLWMGFALVIIIIDTIRINAELRMIQRRINYLKSEMAKKPRRRTRRR